MSKAIAFLLGMLTIIGLSCLVSAIEKNECSGWVNTPGAYQQWQVDQCNHYNIELDR